MSSEEEVRNESYTSLEFKFHRACTQLLILQDMIDEIQVRCDRAAAMKRQAFCQNLHFKLSLLKGVWNMYYRYARGKAEELDAMKHQMLAALGL